MTLTSAAPPFDGEEIFIPNPAVIVDVSVDHSIANADCTRVVLNNGEVFHVRESVDEIQEMIRAANIQDGFKSYCERQTHYRTGWDT